ncbi:outer membrane protein/protective antigen OMA87 [Klebsiella quasipneumoniae]|nr:outer membrane protein/protective antigen OMA87 [Klebsiella quasipneumoniae]
MSRPLNPVLLLLTCALCAPVQAKAISREQIDGWLQHLGASDKFDASKGIDWGMMPGPFYTPELGLGIGTAVVGLYRPRSAGYHQPEFHADAQRLRQLHRRLWP